MYAGSWTVAFDLVCTPHLDMSELASSFFDLSFSDGAGANTALPAKNELPELSPQTDDRIAGFTPRIAMNDRQRETNSVAYRDRHTALSISFEYRYSTSKLGELGTSS